MGEQQLPPAREPLTDRRPPAGGRSRPQRTATGAHGDHGRHHDRRDDQGIAVGLRDAAKLLADLPNKIRDVLGIVVDVRLVQEGKQDLIEIHVEPYPSPISYKGDYHVRTGSTKQELKGAALERFLLQKRGRHWDGVPEPAFSLRACSVAAFRLFTARATQSGRMDWAVARRQAADPRQPWS